MGTPCGQGRVPGGLHFPRIRALGHAEPGRHAAACAAEQPFRLAGQVLRNGCAARVEFVEQPQFVELVSTGEQPLHLPDERLRIGSRTRTHDYDGFATTWDGASLGAGQSYYRPLRHRPDGLAVRESDLVFQVPLDDNGSAKIYGLAVLDTGPDGAVLGLAPFTDWPPAMDPNSF